MISDYRNLKHVQKFQFYTKLEKLFKSKISSGCAPNNIDSEDYLKPGETVREHDFLFSCEQGEDGVLNYEATACIDAFGETMHPGETRRLSNGTVVLHCNIFGGALKKVVERGMVYQLITEIPKIDEPWSLLIFPEVTVRDRRKWSTDKMIRRQFTT